VALKKSILTLRFHDFRVFPSLIKHPCAESMKRIFNTGMLFVPASQHPAGIQGLALVIPFAIRVPTMSKKKKKKVSLQCKSLPLDSEQHVGFPSGPQLINLVGRKWCNLERDAPLRITTSNCQLGGKLCCLLACWVCEVSVR